MTNEPAGQKPVLMREYHIRQLIPVSRETLRRWIQTGEFPPGKRISPRIVVWPRDVVYAWLAEHS